MLFVSSGLAMVGVFFKKTSSSLINSDCNSNRNSSNERPITSHSTKLEQYEKMPNCAGFLILLSRPREIRRIWKRLKNKHIRKLAKSTCSKLDRTYAMIIPSLDLSADHEEVENVGDNKT